MSTQETAARPYSLLFQALSNKTRMEILNLLRERGSMSVSQITEKLDAEQTRISHGLRCLEFCGLVTAKREGKSRIYSINTDTVLPMLEIAGRHLNKHARKLFDCDALKR